MGFGHKATRGAYIKATGDIRIHWLPRKTDPFGWANGTVRLELLSDGRWIHEISPYQGDGYGLTGFELDDLKPRNLVNMEYSLVREALLDGKWLHGDPRLLDSAVRVFGPRQAIRLPGVVIPVVMDDQSMVSYCGSTDTAVRKDIKARLKIGPVYDPQDVCKIEFSE